MGVDNESAPCSHVSLDLFRDIFHKVNPEIEIEELQEAQGSGRGDNYTAALYRIQLKGFVRRGGDDGKKLRWEKSVICKQLPDSRASREAYKSEELFRNEVEFYTKILPELLAFQKTKTKDIFKAIPQCYLARNDLLVLEDLRVRDFKMPDRHAGLSLDQTEAVLKELARFHSLSLAYKHEFPEKFAKLTETITEGIFATANTEWYRNYYKGLTKSAVDAVSQTLPKNSHYVDHVKEFAESDSFFARMVTLVKDSGPLAVICHGDCWTNNFLYKYDDNGHILETCLVDFQLIRFGSPALDLANLIFCCTDRDQRKHHLDRLLRVYCNELRESLATMGPLPDEFRTTPDDDDGPWRRLQAEFKAYGRFGLGLAMDIIPISTCSSEEAPDLYMSMSHEITGAPELCVAPTDAYRRKMTDIVIDLVDAGML